MTRNWMTIFVAAFAPALPGQIQRAELPAPPDLVPTVRIVSVGDLAVDPAQFKRAPAATLQQIAAFASRFVQPPLRGQEEIKSLGDKTLIGLLRPSQHRWLTQFVDQNQKQKSMMVQVQCEFVQMETRAYQRLAAPLLVRGGKKLRHAVLATGEKTTKYLANLNKVKGADVVHAPRLLALPTQLAHITVMRQMTYVKDFNATFDEDGKPKSIDPVIGVVRDGMWLKSTCGFVENGVLGLSLQAHWSDLKQPIKKVELRIKGCESTLEIGVPELKVGEIEADVRVPSGGTVMFELSETQGRHQLVFVTVTAIDPTLHQPFGPNK